MIQREREIVRSIRDMAAQRVECQARGERATTAVQEQTRRALAKVDHESEEALTQCSESIDRARRSLKEAGLPDMAIQLAAKRGGSAVSGTPKDISSLNVIRMRTSESAGEVARHIAALDRLDKRKSLIVRLISVGIFLLVILFLLVITGRI